MAESKYRVLIVTSHAIQYMSPLFRLMAQHPKLDILVAYCSLQGAEKGIDPGFGLEVVWDIPLLDGYPWTQVANKSFKPGLGRFFGLINPELWNLIDKGNFDAVFAYTGYMYASFWIAVAAVKKSHTPLLFYADTTSLLPRDGKGWKLGLKKFLLPLIYRLIDIAIAPAAATAEFYRSLAIPDERIVLTPFVADNDWWKKRCIEVDRTKVRNQWGIPENSSVLLFCAKLQPWKRPEDVLKAFVKANVSDAYLVFAGDGPLRPDLEAEVKSLGLDKYVKFLGFVNQSQLPATYSSADVFILPSNYDPCPVVVCEAMLCGCPIILSDQIRGRFDLVKEGKTGFIYPCGDIDSLANIIKKTLPDREQINQMSLNARLRMETWSPHDNVEAFVQAVEKAVQLKSLKG